MGKKWTQCVLQDHHKGEVSSIKVHMAVLDGVRSTPI